MGNWVWSSSNQSVGENVGIFKAHQEINRGYNGWSLRPRHLQVVFSTYIGGVHCLIYLFACVEEDGVSYAGASAVFY